MGEQEWRWCRQGVAQVLLQGVNVGIYTTLRLARYFNNDRTGKKVTYRSGYIVIFPGEM